MSVKSLTAGIRGIFSVNKAFSKYSDDFRIRTVSLNSGEKLCYPEYRFGMLSSWRHITFVNNRIYRLSDSSDDPQIALSMSEAEQYIHQYKNQLQEERSMDIVTEEVISV